MQILEEIQTENKCTNLDRLSAILDRLPAEERAIVWEGVVRDLTERLQEQR